MPQQWFVDRGEREQGPLSARELKQLAVSGKLSATDLVRTAEKSEWRQAGSVSGLFPTATPSAPVPPPHRLPQNSPAPSAAPPPVPTSSAANVASTVRSGVTDVLSTAKQAKDLAAAHARKTQINQMTLPKAYFALGKEVFESGRFREQFADLFQRITATNEEIAKVAAADKERPQATDLKGKLQAGAAHLLAQGHVTKLGLQRDSLLRELGQRAFESSGTSAGSPEPVSSINSANEEVAKLDRHISNLSSGEQGTIWQRLPIAALLTVCCLPVGLFLVWFNPRLSRRSKWIWTGVSLGAFMVLGMISPKSTNGIPQAIRPSGGSQVYFSLTDEEKQQGWETPDTASGPYRPPAPPVSRTSFGRLQKGMNRFEVADVLGGAPHKEKFETWRDTDRTTFRWRATQVYLGDSKGVTVILVFERSDFREGIGDEPLVEIISRGF